MGKALAKCTIERRCKQRNGPLLGHGLDISQLRRLRGLGTVNFIGSFKLNCSSTERSKLTQDHRWIDKQSDEKTEVLLIRC